MHVMSSFLMHIRERALFSAPFGWKPGLFTLIPWLMPARIVDSVFYVIRARFSLLTGNLLLELQYTNFCSFNTHLF